MIRLTYGVLGLVCCMFVSLTYADVVYLKDGVKKEGKILEEKEGIVVLEVEMGRLKAKVRIKQDEIERIERKTAPTDLFEKRLSEVKPEDAEGYYKLGIWAEEQKMSEKAKMAFEKALTSGNGHAAAAAKLGYIKVGTKWEPASSALESAKSIYKDGKFEDVYTSLNALKESPKGVIPSNVMDDLLMLYAKACERLSRWAEAVDAWYAYKAATTNKTDVAVALCHINVLETHTDGKFPCDQSALPPTLTQFDPSLAGIVAQGGQMPLSDEAIMDLALKAQAIGLCEESEKNLQKVVDNSESSENALRTAASKAESADALLPGCAKQLRLKIVRRNIELVLDKSKKLLDDLHSKASYDASDMFAGKVSDAQDCLRDSKQLLNRYEQLRDSLKGLEKDLPDEIEHVEKIITDENKRCQWLEGQIVILNIKKKAEELEATASANLNKGLALDPRKHTYTVNSLTRAFSDGGKKWKENTDGCVRCLGAALAALGEKLKQYQKRPDIFGAEIEDTKRRMTECHGLQKEVLAVRDQKGIAQD